MSRRCTFDEDLAKRLYDNKHSDAYIAGALGVSITTVFRWRTRNGLPANSPTPAGGTRPVVSVDIPDGLSPADGAGALDGFEPFTPRRVSQPGSPADPPASPPPEGPAAAPAPEQERPFTDDLPSPVQPPEDEPPAAATTEDPAAVPTPEQERPLTDDPPSPAQPAPEPDPPAVSASVDPRPVTVTVSLAGCGISLRASDLSGLASAVHVVSGIAAVLAGVPDLGTRKGPAV